MAISPTVGCYPTASVFVLSAVGTDCCTLIYSYNESVSISQSCIGTPFQTNYYPNRCTANPRTALGTLTMIVPMTLDFSFSVDDEAIIDGAIYQAGAFPVTLGSGDNGNTCSFFPGGPSACNGAHTASGSVTKTKGSTFTFQAGDNHGIQCFGNGLVTAKFTGAP